MSRLVAEHPRVVPRRNLQHLARSHLHRDAVSRLDVRSRQSTAVTRARSRFPAVAGRPRAPPMRPSRSGGIARQTTPRALSERAIRASVREQEDHHVDAAVTHLRPDPSFECLPVAGSRLGFDTDPEVAPGDDGISCAQISRVRHRNLCRPAHGGVQQPPKTFEQRRVRRIAKSRADWKRARRNFQANDGRENNQLEQRNGDVFAALDSADFRP